MFGINTHIHLPPNFSAFETVEQAVQLAAQQDIGILGASNYYDFTVYEEFERLCVKRGITPLFGVEIVVGVPELAECDIRVNDPGNPGKMYLCGKGLTYWREFTPAAIPILNQIRYEDSIRIIEMIRRLRRMFEAEGLDTELWVKQVVDMVVQRHDCSNKTVFLQERHVAQAFQEALFRIAQPDDIARALSRICGTEITFDGPSGLQTAIRSHLMKAGKPAYVREVYVTFDDAVTLIHELGGVPCYPVLADGAKPICEYEADIDSMISDLTARGIRHAEFIPVRNDPEVLRRYVTALHKAGFSVTAGTEHNTLEMIPLTPTCLGGAAIPEDVQEIFGLGAEELVRHQS